MCDALVLFLDLDASLHLNDLGFEEPTAHKTRLNVVRNALKCFLQVHAYSLATDRTPTSVENHRYAVYGVLDDPCVLLPLSPLFDPTTTLNTALSAIDQYFPHRANFASNLNERPLSLPNIVACMHDVHKQLVKMGPQLGHQSTVASNSNSGEKSYTTRGILIASRSVEGGGTLSSLKTQLSASQDDPAVTGSRNIFLDVLALGAGTEEIQHQMAVDLHHLGREKMLKSFSVTGCSAGLDIGNALSPLLTDVPHRRRWTCGLRGNKRTLSKGCADPPVLRALGKASPFMVTFPKPKVLKLTLPPPPQEEETAATDAPPTASVPTNAADKPQVPPAPGTTETAVMKVSMEDIFGKGEKKSPQQNPLSTSPTHQDTAAAPVAIAEPSTESICRRLVQSQAEEVLSDASRTTTPMSATTGGNSNQPSTSSRPLQREGTAEYQLQQEAPPPPPPLRSSSSPPIGFKIPDSSVYSPKKLFELRGEERQEAQERIATFYSQFNPDEMHKAVRALNYDYTEGELMAKLYAKYCGIPTSLSPLASPITSRQTSFVTTEETNRAGAAGGVSKPTAVPAAQGGEAARMRSLVAEATVSSPNPSITAAAVANRSIAGVKKVAHDIESPSDAPLTAPPLPQQQVQSATIHLTLRKEEESSSGSAGGGDALPSPTRSTGEVLSDSSPPPSGAVSSPEIKQAVLIEPGPGLGPGAKQNEKKTSTVTGTGTSIGGAAQQKERAHVDPTHTHGQTQHADDMYADFFTEGYGKK